MKYLLLIIIKCYWLVIPKSKRRKCLFKISCSNYVYKKTKTEGVISGLNALKFRIKNCNPNYNIIEINGEKVLVTKRNKNFKENEIDISILN
ncbi:membrane protein insertion efficiency factor YidD [bacterium AH-315-P13]|nr:membrane protein insertion efficiency factor YidD [bacterium AH-315-P13]